VSEAGLPGYEATVWWGIAAPAKTPREVVQKLNTEVAKVLADPVNARKLNELGVVVTPQSPEQFTSYINAQTDLWSGVVKAGNIQPE
jgi:tripartite-type tricarboxylate transporter receptor subunit TctC